MSPVFYQKIYPLFYVRLKTFTKICALAVLVLLLTVSCVYFLDVGAEPVIFTRNSNLTEMKMEIKTILYWTGMFNSKTFWFGEGEIFQGCEISACRTTTDRNFMNIEEFNALLFHGVENRVYDLPPVRSNKQKYVFVLLESPANYGLDDNYIPDQFYNWTMTYRRDSDIPRPYGLIIDSVSKDVAYPRWARNPNAPSNDVIYENLRHKGNYVIIEGKRKTAAWFVSHCSTVGLRDRYVADLQKYIDIDIYGDCGSLSCKSGGVKCYKMMESRYYFYLAFENSLCQDYVTEKLFKIMSYNVVPIVYGAVNYSEFAPPGSYIDVADFESPKHLAMYLKHLVDAPEQYAKFFLWKKHFSVDLSHRKTLCQMCEMLHNENTLAPSSVSDMKKWWAKDKCQNSLEFLKKIMP